MLAVLRPLRVEVQPAPISIQMISSARPQLLGAEPGEEAESFEAQLRTNEHGQPMWMWKPLEDIVVVKAKTLAWRVEWVFKCEDGKRAMIADPRVEESVSPNAALARHIGATQLRLAELQV